MAENSKIEWTDHTFNPWIGCTKVSPGCMHCYAENLMDTRHGRVKWGKGQPRSLTSPANWREPVKWNKKAGDDEAFHASEAPLHDEGDFAPYVRPRVFCASLADWLDDEVPLQWLADLLDLIRQTPHLDWLLLTKRPQNWSQRIQLCFSNVKNPDGELSRWLFDWIDGNPPANVWIGTSVEDQERADVRIPALLRIPARVRFLSMEPLLGAVDLTRVNADPMGETDALRGVTFCEGRNEPAEHGRINWVIVGGESGAHARPMHPVWATSLRDQCKAAGVPFLFKQWGEWLPTSPNTEAPLNALFVWDAGQRSVRIGKKSAGRLLDGVEHNGFPTL